ncbi:MAG: ATP-binding protein [Chloroflexota bacterium]|nr:ATP-binding protein [Chloroflexota bacterium]
MSGEEGYRLSYAECRTLLARRLAEPAPSRIQLLSGPRQVGKTTLLLELARVEGDAAVYFAADGPEAALPGSWQRLWIRAEQVARDRGRCVVLIDEAHLLHDWATGLKGEWDRLHRRRLRIHVVASGSSALRLAAGSRESLAGRFERLTLTHWSAASLASVFGIASREAAEMVVRYGSYPGAYALRGDRRRWMAYVRDAILEPAIGRDLLALAAVRRPALLRQVFGVCAGSPAQIVSLQKIQGQLQDPGALETIAHYLELLEEAYLVAALDKHAARATRRRSAPPKLVTLNNALLAVSDPAGVPDPEREPARSGAWVENACLAHAWNTGQRVRYWREEPLEVDAVVDGSWGSWVIEVSLGRIDEPKVRALSEFARRHPRYRPLVITDARARPSVERYGIDAVDWQDFLVSGPPGSTQGWEPARPANARRAGE